MNMTETPEQVVLEPSSGKASACLIWLHGLGADGYDFVPVVQHMGSLMDTSQLRCIFPHAPKRPVTMANGTSMRSWYDILAMTPKRTIDPDQLADSVNRMYRLIQQQIDSGIPSWNIFITGFSQGGAVAYQTASSFGQTLGGLIALSTYVPDGSRVNPFKLHPANCQLQVMIAHGTVDPVVPISLATTALEQLRQHGLQPLWFSYPMQHEVSHPEIADVCRFLSSCLSHTRAS
ncbi:alpha/beta hydrolase [Oceanobacter sp. 3_MG-2023]|uniref:alpha/beta hydrolase n=1 Tax=Oceanobacter sp. 3_MG-2023 TaxID=3062622 RepID=UPI002733D4E9|nr:carboxylesterase [Oceanobacter sp. 3_MG-2023]MDP2504911.1 carboxylesterase [Oceanobacter sp. 3_MG-2023]